MIIDTNFQTPVVVADYMASLVKGKERLVLEPTPGTGRLVAQLKVRGHLVMVPDGDYWQMDHGKTFNW